MLHNLALTLLQECPGLIIPMVIGILAYHSLQLLDVFPSLVAQPRRLAIVLLCLANLEHVVVDKLMKLPTILVSG